MTTSMTSGYIQMEWFGLLLPTAIHANKMLPSLSLVVVWIKHGLESLYSKVSGNQPSQAMVEVCTSWHSTLMHSLDVF